MNHPLLVTIAVGGILQAMDWTLQSPRIPQTADELKKILLENRNIVDHVSFFNPSYPSDLTLKDVGLSKQSVTTALKRIDVAIANQEDILLFGDYDADGVCASAIMWKTLTELGAKVRPFIPHREKHGYGITIAALVDIVAEQKPDLIITLDNGIVAHEAFNWLSEQGIDAIITDHHQPEEKLPKAYAIVHTTELCGTTVAWMLSRELLHKHFSKEKADEVSNNLLDLCAVATVADQVPLTAANRSFAWHGLKRLQSTENPGLQAIIRDAGIEMTAISSDTIGFVIAPRINAMGRLSHALDALRLLCTTSSKTATKLAMIVSKTNITRQGLTHDLFAPAVLQAEQQSDEHILIVSSLDFHEGVIGLIAGRLVEKYHKPSIVISVGESSAKASARSLPGINIVELIRTVRQDLTAVGGHPMAAGFGLHVKNIQKVSEALFSLAKDTIERHQLAPSIQLECELQAQLLDPETVKMFDRFMPFGTANPKPLFSMKAMTILDVRSLGKQSEHLKLTVSPALREKSSVGSSAQLALAALWWGKGELAREFQAGQVINLAGSLEINSYRGSESLQIMVKDIQSS